jgi:hypothetical protein
MISMNTKPDESMAEYDCCPTIYLNDDQVEALGIKGMPAPGTVMMLTARVVVTRVTAEAEEPDEAAAEGRAPDISLSLKITDMEVTKQNSSQDIADALYK